MGLRVHRAEKSNKNRLTPTETKSASKRRIISESPSITLLHYLQAAPTVTDIEENIFYLGHSHCAFMCTQLHGSYATALPAQAIHSNKERRQL